MNCEALAAKRVFMRALPKRDMSIVDNTRTQTASSCSCSSFRPAASAAFNDATGTVKGDSLTVEYDGNMRMADFEDAVYALISG